MARRREEKTLRFDISELPVEHSIFMAERGSLTVLAQCILGWIGCFSDVAVVVYRKLIVCQWALACRLACMF